MKDTTIGIDLAKTTFQVCALNRAGKAISNQPVKRAALTEAVAQLHPTRIAMESYAGAHYWGRTF
jgi:transposase